KNKVSLIKALELIKNDQKYIFWLDYGTLLGAVRNGEIISYDYDIDISMDQKSWTPELKYYLYKYGFVFIKGIHINNVIYEETYSYNGILIDIFYCEINNGRIKTPVFRPFKNHDWPSSIHYYGGVELYTFNNSYSGLKEIKFEGKKFFIPNNFHEQLTSYYGSDYLVPIKNWNGKNAAKETGKCGVILFEKE
ncbi:TPA: LicD family protein, partial [Proteus mirabilis]|nr:LicD family protein [Proteus mirabilis]